MRILKLYETIIDCYREIVQIIKEKQPAEQPKIETNTRSAAGRVHAPVFKQVPADNQKRCKECGVIFTPDTPKQRLCNECKQDMKKNHNAKYRSKKKTVKKNTPIKNVRVDSKTVIQVPVDIPDEIAIKNYKAKHK